MRHAKPVRNKPRPLTAIDVFAGGGALTVGLKRAGFNVVSAVEIEPHAFATYKANHTEVCAYRQDIRTVSGADLKRCSASGEIDLLACCPPCQGFSSLTSKQRRDDPRNALVGEVGRIIKEVEPLALMMENVPGLAKKGKAILDELLKLLEDNGYLSTWDVLQVADYGIPQNRRRLVLLAGKGFKIDLPKPTHSKDGAGDLPKWNTIDGVLKGIPRPIALDKTWDHGGPAAVGWNVVRCISKRTKSRLKQAKPGKAWWNGIPKRLRPACHGTKDAGFSNVYGRMKWGTVAPTITGGCTTFSMGRFGHPSQNRTISVHEAALLQTFPANYRFETDQMEKVCDIIGNALPCDFAAIVSIACRAAIRRHEVSEKRRANERLKKFIRARRILDKYARPSDME